MAQPTTTLAQAQSHAEFDSARTLFIEYADRLGVDLCFQGFASELQMLNTMYGPPGGRLILARQGEEYVGCVGVRRVSNEVCEMKRLYVRDAARGSGLGRRLAEASLDAGRALGYQRIVLDTLAPMSAARDLYATLGFKEIAPYYDNPIEGAIYMALELSAGRPPADPRPEPQL
jgi:putative acetyltransferase